MERREVCVARRPHFRQPLAQLSRFVHRTNATSTRERQGDERIGRAVSHERRLQRRLFSQIKSQQEIEFHRQFLSDLKHAVPAWQK